MLLTFLPMINQATIPITTLNSNNLVTLEFSSNITTTVISTKSVMISINPALAIFVPATGQDLTNNSLQ